MSEDPKENPPIQDPWEQNTGTQNGQEEIQKPEELSGQDPPKSNSEPRIQQDAKDNLGVVSQQAASGNKNTLEERQNQQPLTNQNAEKENETTQQAVVGDKNRQNIYNVDTMIIGKKKGGKKYSSAKKDDDRQSDANQKTDPTKPLPPKSKSLPNVRINNLSDYFKKLQEDYLVVVTCSDSSSALSVAYSLTEEISVSNKRLFTGELAASKKVEEINIDNIVFHPAIEKKESTLIVVDSYEAQTFLDSLVVQPSTAGAIKQDLKNSKRFCICIAESKVLETTLERKQIKSLSFPHLEVPLVEEKATNESLDQKQITASSLYKKADSLRKTVLYVGTLFPGLNISDFERIVFLLLGEKTTLIEEENQVKAPNKAPESTVSLTIGEQVITFNQPQKEVADRSGNQSKAQTKKLLRDLWEEEPEQILQDCFLELFLNEYSSRVINFSLPYLRSELKQYFEERKFIEYRKKFRKFIELNLLFDTSHQVAQALKDLSVSMMLFERGIETCVDWLVQIFIEALEFNTDGKRKDINYIYYCIVGLLRETLNYSELEDILETFLNKLISEKRYDAVIEISKRLKSAPQFDEYYWFSQCINQFYTKLYGDIPLELLDESNQLKPFLVNSGHFPLLLKDFEEQVNFKFQANLVIAEKGKVNAILHYGKLVELKDILQEATKKYMRQNIYLYDFCYKFDDVVRSELIFHLDQILKTHGRRIEGFFPEVDNKLQMPELAPFQYDVEYDIPVYGRLIIKNTLAVEPLKDEGGEYSRHSILKYRKAKISNLEEWLKENLKKTIHKYLFGWKYIDFILKYDEQSIKKLFNVESEKIGYSVKLISTFPDLKPLKLRTEGFRFQADEADQDFATKQNSVRVKLGIDVRGKIENLEKIEDILNDPKNDIDELIKREVLDAISQVLHDVEPDDFYYYFEHHPEEKQEPVKKKLSENVRSVLSSKFHASSIIIYLWIVETDLIRRINKLRSKYCKFEIEVGSIKDAGEIVKYSGYFSIAGVAKENWDRFQFRYCSIEDVRHFMEAQLEYYFRSLGSGNLIYKNSKQAAKILEQANVLMNRDVMNEFGLIVTISSFCRQYTESEQASLLTPSVNDDDDDDFDALVNQARLELPESKNTQKKSTSNQDSPSVDDDQVIDV